MEKILIIPIIMIIALLTIGLVLASNEIAHDDTSTDDGQNNIDGPSVNSSDNNRILSHMSYKNKFSSKEGLEDPSYNFNHDFIVF